MKIKKYTKDKGNKYKVLIDDTNYILFDDVIVKYSLLLKDEISEKELKTIVEENDKLSSYYDSIKYITKKMRSKLEIKEFLRKKMVNENVIDETIKRLEDNHFLNEELFIKAYVNDQINLTNNGKNKILKGLVKLGIDKDSASIYLDNIDNEIFIAKINKYIDKKISTKISRQENKNFEEKEQVLDDNKKVVIEDVENTKFETFIKGKYVKEGITWEEYQNVNMEYSSFLVSTDNGEKIQSIIYQGNASGIDRYVKNSDNEYEKIEDYSTIKNSDIVKVEEHFLILLGRQENINNLLVTPTETKLYNDRTDEEEKMYKKATWYQVKTGTTHYTAKSALGGTFTINNITVDNDYITFYYDINGYIGDEILVLLRDKSVDDMNYFYATNEYKKDVNGEENKIEFSLKDEPRSGLNTYKISSKNIDNLEFTLLFGSNTKIIGEPFKISIPDRDNDDLKFKNIEISDCNFDREDAIMYLNDDISGVIFDNIIITDSNMQVKGKTSTIVENITDMNKETVFITDDSGKKYYNFSSSVNSNEFTMYFKINKKLLKKDKLYINVLKDGKISTSELIRK